MLALNHFMLSGDTRSARVVFYALACVVPVAVIVGWRIFVRAFRGTAPDDLREVSIPTLYGCGIALSIYLISLCY